MLWCPGSRPVGGKGRVVGTPVRGPTVGARRQAAATSRTPCTLARRPNQAIGRVDLTIFLRFQQRTNVDGNGRRATVTVEGHEGRAGGGEALSGIGVPDDVVEDDGA